MNSNIRFTLANPETHVDALIALNMEYMDWVMAGLEEWFGFGREELLGETLDDYVRGSIGSVCGDAPPSGVFYLIELDGELAGMGGLRRLSGEIAEIKRLYIRPPHRGLKLGETAFRRLITDAMVFGYQQVRLDSAPFMLSAHRLYEKHGFIDCTPYEGTEVPSHMQGVWRFMQRRL